MDWKGRAEEGYRTNRTGLDWRICDAATLSIVPGAGTDTKSIFLALGYRSVWGGNGGSASVSI